MKQIGYEEGCALILFKWFLTSINSNFFLTLQRRDKLCVETRKRITVFISVFGSCEES